MLALTTTIVVLAVGAPHLPVHAGPNSLAASPCPQKPHSTLDYETCDEHQLLRLGRQFNIAADTLWPMLSADGRDAFARSQTAWLAYRTQECRIEADRYEGGTASGLVYGGCDVQLTTARLAAVQSLIRNYCRGVVHTGRFRRCPRNRRPQPG